jgi:hypothetical protein
MIDGKSLLTKLEKFKYPALILAIGLFLLLLPGSSAKKEESQDPNALLQDVLSHTEGVGEAKVLISDSGVVVICRGAENPKVRLDIIRAVISYTGFGSDKITVLKMSDQT